MSNKKIHELPELDPEDFEPGNDKFIIQSEGDNNKGTYSSTITEMINNGSAELPGSTDWQWNFLDEPATIVGFQFGGTANKDHPSTGGGLTASEIRINDIDVTVDKDGNATGIPKTAQNYLCVVCSRNVGLNFFVPRGKIKIIDTKNTANNFDSPRDSYANYINATSAFTKASDIANPIQEKMFVVENISFPQDRKIDIDSGKNPTYRDAGKINLSITPHVHLSSTVGHDNW